MAAKRRLARVALAVLAVLLVPRAALAYIDPGTTSSLFALLGPLLAIGGAFLGYLLWPFRKALFGVFRRGGKAADAAPADAPPQTDGE